MTQQIATVSLFIFIIVIQHLYNWSSRKLYDKLGYDSIALLLALTTFVFVITFALCELLLGINK
jgi:hypothetical protein